MRKVPAILILAIISSAALSAQDGTAPLRWYKGNTHAHTLNSDGDSTPDEVVRWYREHGYNFLVLSDHNFLTEVKGLNAVHAAAGKFIVVPGVEVTDRFGDKPIHVNGLDLHELVEPQGGTSVSDTIQRNVNAIRKVDGIPHINHPNFGWAITAEDLKKISNNRLFEIYNGHPLVNNAGGGRAPGLEEVWDILLSSGMTIYGIAVDDAHHFKRPWDSNASRPGRGWVVVRSAELSSRALVDAMERGDFYASTGVELEDYAADSKQISIKVRPRGDTKYRILFIGQEGRVLAEVTESPAVYNIRGDESYVRAKVIDSNGHFAWTQPVRPQ